MAWLSPVSITARTPSSRSAATAALAVSRGESAIAMIPAARAVERDLHGGAALSGQRRGALGEAVEADVLALQQPRVADREPVALDGGERADTRDGLEVADRRGGSRPRWWAALTIA